MRHTRLPVDRNMLDNSKHYEKEDVGFNEIKDRIDENYRNY